MMSCRGSAQSLKLWSSKCGCQAPNVHQALRQSSSETDRFFRLNLRDCSVLTVINDHAPVVLVCCSVAHRIELANILGESFEDTRVTKLLAFVKLCGAASTAWRGLLVSLALST